jgi:hypothetical protein
VVGTKNGAVSVPHCSGDFSRDSEPLIGPNPDLFYP